MRGCTRILLSLLSFAFAGSWAHDHATAAENWPQQAVRIIVPFPAGSGIDVAVRIIGDGLAKRWERPVVVENKPGAETTIGAGAFAAARDGHTLLYTTFGTLSVAPLTVEKLPFDPEVDLVPLVPTVSVVVAVSVTSSLAVRTLAELEAAHPRQARTAAMDVGPDPAALRIRSFPEASRIGNELRRLPRCLAAADRSR